MILAAAIKYYINDTKETVVLCGCRHGDIGCRHGDIFEQLKLLGFKPCVGYKEIEQGFINHKGEFLTRIEAFEDAKKCGQLADKIICERENKSPFGKKLISEDLW